MLSLINSLLGHESPASSKVLVHVSSESGDSCTLLMSNDLLIGVIKSLRIDPVLRRTHLERAVVGWGRASLLATAWTAVKLDWLLTTARATVRLVWLHKLVAKEAGAWIEDSLRHHCVVGSLSLRLKEVGSLGQPSLILLLLVQRGKDSVGLRQDGSNSRLEHGVKVHHLQTFSPVFLFGHWTLGKDAAVLATEVLVSRLSDLGRNLLDELVVALASSDL